MKILYLIIALSFFNNKLNAQSWAKKGTVFIYAGSVFELSEDNNKPETLKVIKNFQIKVDSIITLHNAKFVFLSNYFDAIHAGFSHSSEVPVNVCLATYNDTLYNVSFQDKTQLDKSINVKDLFSNKLSSIYVDKQYSILKFNSQKKSKRYIEELAPNDHEPEFSFKKMVKLKGKISTDAANLVAEDGRGSYITNIYYNNSFFIAKYVSKLYRASTPYKLELSLIKVTK